MITYWVRCTLSQTGSYVASVWDAPTKTANPVDFIDTTKAMMIELKTDDANSELPVRGFGLSVNPDIPAEVVVKPISRFDIQINDLCAHKDDVNLHATVTLANNNTIDSGKPIIRNRPAVQPPTVPPTRLFVIAALVIVTLVCIFAIGHYVLNLW